MSDALDISDEEMLARLAACDLTAAERVHSRLMAAEEASDIAELGRTYQRIARSLRQTLALKQRFRREREADARDAPPAKPSADSVARRVRELRQAVTRIIWNEAEGEDAREHEENLDDLIARKMQFDSFGSEPLDDQVARTCLELGLSLRAVESWRDLPDPPDAADESGDEPSDEPDLDSSA